MRKAFFNCREKDMLPQKYSRRKILRSAILQSRRHVIPPHEFLANSERR
jgi:hypothetical protein